MNIKKFLYISLLNILVSIGCISHTQAREIDSFLTHEDSTYVVEYEFTTTCGEDVLLEILYEFSHLIKFAKTQNTTIRQLEKGDNWYKVRYDYHYFIYKSSSIYKKTIVPEDHLVKFEMINYTQNIAIMPRVLAASGYYKITQEKGKNKVTYYQETILEHAMGWYYLKRVKSQTKEFLMDLEDYVKEFEDKID